MVHSRKMPDMLFLCAFGMLVIIGALAFLSASLGLLARGDPAIASIVRNHFLLGLGGGLVAFFITMYIPYAVWRNLAPYLYVASVLLTALIFVPGFGLEHGGSSRWVDFGFTSLQPSEPLKIGLIFALAAYFTHYRNKLADWRYGMGGFIALVTAPTALLLLQPDHGTLIVIFTTAGAIFFSAGAPVRHIVTLLLAAVLLLGASFAMHPYTLARVATFFNPVRDPSGSSYQIKQSLLAIGSGETFGRGFGRGIQKFQYLPEPVGDSIFAVIGEEFGFAGASAVIALFALFFMRGFSIAARSSDFFGSLLAVGIVTYISTHFIFNIGSMLGLVPLTGIPLIFISQGGTALFVALGAAGILVNISRSARRV